MKIHYILKILQNAIFGMLLLACNTSSKAQNKQISVTIDDLPFVGEYRNFHLNLLMNAMKSQQIPATGFIIGREVRKNNWKMLHKFRDAGFGVGNHTWSHANLNRVEVKQYKHEIKEADDLLASVLTEPKYFRYPYLAMSSGKKRDKILCYLSKKHYKVAPITIDSKDFAFNQRLLSVPEADRRNYLNELKSFYLDFIWQQTLAAEAVNTSQKHPGQAQILLIHANLLNAYVLPDIIEMYKGHDYSFVSLEHALKTFSHITQCSKIKQKPMALAVNDSNIESFMDWD